MAVKKDEEKEARTKRGGRRIIVMLFKILKRSIVI